MSIDSASMIKDSNLWLEDGNVVVVAQDTAFRVHRGLLSRHSEVFSGLFTLAQPDDEAAAELYDGCPVVRVPDSSHDFRHLLHALYDGLSTIESVHESAKFNIYAALARLADKYELPHIFTAAIKWLGTIFTDTYTVWHDLWTEHGSTGGIMSDLAINPIEAANLFRITGQDRMRPTALFLCCQLDVPVLLSGLPRADGVVEVLSSDDLQHCLQARIRFTAEMTTFMHMFYFLNANAPALGCSMPDSCPDSFAPERDDHRTHVFTANDSYYQNPFKISVSMCRKIIEDKCASGELCDRCANDLMEHVRALGKSSWNTLPEDMGLGESVQGWEEVALMS
ncbi:hypothetical protein L227DRAFT_239457 [Lentinus tigrinus ALCF2SS1-6]|uniref:BTB domain-containing protein n=1 Tax=Lentinus tigrinus ALCF2SS1-6 TaxID=1328759 RepID=A0A5C2S185_9APHY|nr:hypothetical protein L227DRAFT_239457 [Lentinus tigrinus ALCF2SS1-6]